MRSTATGVCTTARSPDARSGCRERRLDGAHQRAEAPALPAPPGRKMSRDSLAAGVDFTTDAFTPQERDQTLAWYRERHDVGDLDLSPFARFSIEHDPAW